MDWRGNIGRFEGRSIPVAPWVRWTFLALMAVAAVLRFWRFWEIPYMHDELSALVRIYPSLEETIQRGVIELDTHPPGVQVFEWLWTRLFGMVEGLVKLPFILMSLAAIFLLYRVAMAWTAAPTALLLTALMATLQYSVLYGQLARPYAVGLFTTALLADQLTRYLAHGRLRALLGIGVAAVLSAYTHHFALLLAGIMGATGLLLVSPTQRRNYLLMGGAVLLCYLPNIPILLHQLGQGGLSEWLAPPDRWWLLDHAWWIAHCSWVLALALLALLGLSLARRLRIGALPGPGRWIFITWGLVPLLIGLGYSVWRAPVIQHSVLLFSFPYLALALLSGLRELGKRSTVIATAAVVVLSVVTLIGTRQHYALFYTSKYEAMVATARNEVATHGSDKVAVLFDAPPEVLDFYFRHWSIAPGELPHVRLRDNGFTPGRLDSLLAMLPQERLVYGQSNGAPIEQLPRIQLHYPFLLERTDLAEGQVFLLGRTTTVQAQKDHTLMTSAQPHMEQGGGWDIHADLPIDSTGTGGQYFWDLSGREYGALVQLKLDTAAQHLQDQFEISARLIVPREADDFALVVELKQGDSTLFYRTAELREMGPAHNDSILNLIVAARPADAGKRQQGIMLRAYIHNRKGASVRLIGMEVYRRMANPVVYSITGPIQGEWTYHPK